MWYTMSCVFVLNPVKNPIGDIHNLSKRYKKVQVGKDQEKAQPEKYSHSKNQGGKKKQTNNKELIP